MTKRLIFLLGGARSGKSQTAEAWVREHGGRALFVATAQPTDADMCQRIADHRASRPADWHTLEAPINTADQIAASSFAYDTLILDCVTLMISNILVALPEAVTQVEANEAALAAVDLLLAAQAQSDATWLVVSNEVAWASCRRRGWGICIAICWGAPISGLRKRRMRCCCWWRGFRGG